MYPYAKLAWVEFQTDIYTHTGHMTDKVKNIIITWSAAYCTTEWTLNKHFIVTLQRNVGGGRTGM
jgi:hypothetical protein